MRLILCLLLAPAGGLAAVPVEVGSYRPGPVRVEQRGEILAVEWKDEASRPCRAWFALDPEAALIREISTGGVRVLENAGPVYAVTTDRKSTRLNSSHQLSSYA